MSALQTLWPGRSRWPHWLAVVALIVPSSIAAADTRPPQPNVVLLLADDLGWQDVTCYDIDEPSPMETPNLDALARRGVMFWQAYSPAPVCSPSRAAILSGLHPVRGEMTSVAGGDPPCPATSQAPSINPYNTARMPTERFTLAEALKREGYATGHSGKWHVSLNHTDYPTPSHHGFEFSCHDRGIQVPMVPDRLTGFATRAADDPFRLDENGLPTDAAQHAALDFIRAAKDRPFFLYYATWLVHAPIVMRSEPLLRKYEQKLGVTLTEEHAASWKQPGQTNPFYCAMVEQLDAFMGQIFECLATTPDPRWPGHMLADNTVVIFTSDNGGMEGTRDEIYTDNAPLDRGKISLHEGGIRVPLLIAGPGIPRNVQTEVMASGLDIYPTILSLVGAEKPAGKRFDGCDLGPLLTADPTDPTLVKDARGIERDTLFWHFPQSETSSAIRVGDTKLFRQYRDTSWDSAVYRLSDTSGGQVRRCDIEERHDLAADDPQLSEALDRRLTELIESAGGRLPYGNPRSPRPLPGKEQAPEIVGHQRQGREVRVAVRTNGVRLEHADIIYSPNNGREWLRMPAAIVDEQTVTATLPPEASHYFINLVDANNFLVIDPVVDREMLARSGQGFADVAHDAGFPEPRLGERPNFEKIFRDRVAVADGRSVLVQADFETATAAELERAGATIDRVEFPPASGRHRLRLQEAGRRNRPWMPLVAAAWNLPPDRAAGRLQASFDVRLAPEGPGEVIVDLVADGSPAGRRTAGQVVIGSGGVTLNRRRVAPLRAGVWYRFDLACEVGPAAAKSLSLTVTSEKGETWTATMPSEDLPIEHPTRLQLSSVGRHGSELLIDNLVVTLGPGQVP